MNEIDGPFDVLIVGAGISGIGMAAHLQAKCPAKRFAILERRERLGGTWDLFRYPGVRSDSDMYTLGYEFEPWREERSIAPGDTILDYLDMVVDDHDIRRHIRLGQKVLSADWDSAGGLWTLRVADETGKVSTMTGRFLFLGSGYYDYDDPHDADIPGLGAFGGQIVHPQFWPDGLDFDGKRVVVIGSGATAVTLVPAMTETAAHVTMLQRTPTWFVTRPSRDRIANMLNRLLPAKIAYALSRLKNILMGQLLITRSRNQPEAMKEFLHGQLAEQLGPDYNRADFSPPYNPWEQRMCLVPDGDFFRALKAEKASIATGRIATVDATGIALVGGQHIDADIIITATGLRLAVGGKIAVSLDGAPVKLAEHFYYRNAMFSNVPNFAMLFGYLNASWTLRVDIVADWLCRLFNQMDKWGVDVATPHLAPDHGLVENNAFDYFSSGYIKRASHLIPKSSNTPPWQISMDYRSDRQEMRHAPIDDGVLRFGKASAGASTSSA